MPVLRFDVVEITIMKVRIKVRSRTVFRLPAPVWFQSQPHTVLERRSDANPKNAEANDAWRRILEKQDVSSNKES